MALFDLCLITRGLTPPPSLPSLQSLMALFDLVGGVSEHLPKDELPSHYKSVFKFYLVAFDLRGLHAAKVQHIALRID